MALLAGLAAAVGVYLGYTGIVLGWSGAGPTRPLRPVRSAPARRRRDLLPDVGAVAALAALGGLTAFVVFGSVSATIGVALAAGVVPAAARRRRHDADRDAALEHWPRLIEAVRAHANAGASLPQALFQAGRHAPAPLTGSFEAAHREWRLTTDFARTLDVLKHRLADAAVDATCETLLVAHEVGGHQLDRRLAELAEDRRQDLQARRDARARQAGVRFARRFVLLVPLGMAGAGMSVGTGRAAYGTAGGQLLVLVGLALVAACWIWAGRLLLLPKAERVFAP